MAATLPLVACLLAACASSPATSAAIPPSTTGNPSSSAATTGGGPAAPANPAASPAAPMTRAATGTATNSQGDAAKVSVSIGKPVPLLTLNQAALTACSSFDVITDGADETMAIPIQVTATLTSSIATSLDLVIDGTNVVAAGGNVNTNPNGEEPWVTYDSNSACSTADQDGELEWDNLAPGQSVTWSGWELDPDVITPDDTSGSAVNQVIFMLPEVGFGTSGGAGVDTNAAHSRDLVNCSAVYGGPVIAVDPSVALANGCTAVTGS